MNKLTPYIFPALVVIIVVFLITRWYDRRGEISDYGEGIEIENLSEEELSEALSGVGDYTTVPLEEVAPKVTETEDEAVQKTSPIQPLNGVLRYEIEDGKVKLSVIASGAENDNYYVWLQPDGATEPKQAFALTEGKGGLIGSGAFSVEQLPVDVMITRGMSLDRDMGNVVLKGRVNEEVSE
ncbi:MAG TPA: hypothetical protein PKX78_00060 [Candidatus Woesebacteria bacterium]|nr:hypothetical protein [Candidatus Woesebacteria bacterium]